MMIWCWIRLRGYATVGPRLTSGTKVRWYSVLHIAGWMMRNRSPSLPLHRWVWMDAALVLICLCNTLIVSYPG